MKQFGQYAPEKVIRTNIQFPIKTTYFDSIQIFVEIQISQIIIFQSHNLLNEKKTEFNQFKLTN